MPNQATATARALQPQLVGRLAKFFPEATPVRIPITLSGGSNRSHANPDEKNTGKASSGKSENEEHTFLEETVIEFGTSNEVLFALDRPVEFADRVLLESVDGTLRAEASVVAVQYHPNRTVVAARFLKHVPNWIVKS